MVSSSPHIVPRHVAVIPDGNRRWGKKHGSRSSEGLFTGHERGLEKLREITRASYEKGIPYITFWVASEDNLVKRSPAEIRYLVMLLKRELAKPDLLEEFKNNEVRIRFVGRGTEILKDEALVKAIGDLEAKTSDFLRHRLTLLFGYDGKREMLEAIKKIRATPPGEIEPDAVKRALWTGDLPPVDLVIRTGEETPGWDHWSSGFMMWQTADSELYFTQALWPDFSPAEYSEVIRTFGTRPRKFGL